MLEHVFIGNSATGTGSNGRGDLEGPAEGERGRGWVGSLLGRMELFQSRTEYTVRGADSCLSCSRSSGSMEIKAASEVDLSSAVCLGLVEGVIGKFQFHPDLECFLVLVQQKGLVGTVPGKHDMYKITKVAVIPLTDADPPDLKLEYCKTHQQLSSESAETLFPRKVTGDSSSRRQFSDEKLERRLLEELVKMFTDSDSFYYSLTYDITNTAQRQQCGTEGQLRTPPGVDDRFFWNKYMIQDLLKRKGAMTDQWIIPIIQGFVQVEEIHVRYGERLTGESASSDRLADEQPLSSPESKFLLVLISRRSRHRGGMRYKRRGVDSDGHVANYVETEQLIYNGDDILSFVQIRGSVPVFWSQEGYRYKPSPKLHKSEEENKHAFQTHFREQFKIYNKQVIINLVNQTGTEKLIADAYLRHFKMLNDPRLIYVAFDFHQQCQGRKFENVEILTNGISDIINDLKWFRLSKGRVLKVQEGVPRVNCMDSLDRTNLVQSIIARKILEQQLKVLKILPQQRSLPSSIQRIFQIMWANNGDAISRQYAGTAAMKSDFTRTGERKLSGVMKDGYRSANRYYLCHFRHAYRQTVIDMMHGCQLTKGFHNLLGKEKPAKALLIKEHRRSQKQEIEDLILHCSSLLIPAAEKCLGGRLFIDCDPRLRDSAEQNLDLMLLVSSEACYFAHINKESEVSHSRRIALSEVNRIEIGLQPVSKEKSKKISMKLHYRGSGRRANQYTLSPALQHSPDSSRGRSLYPTWSKSQQQVSSARIRTNRFMEGMWNLLRSILQLLVTTIKSCQLRNRKVDTSADDRVEESSGASETRIIETPGLRRDIPCIIEPPELDALHPPDQEVSHGRVISIHLPKDGMAALQVFHDTDTSDTEGPSRSSWLNEGSCDLISLQSTPSASTLGTTSSFSSDYDSNEDELGQTRNSPDICQLREQTWLRDPSAHRIRFQAPGTLRYSGCQPSREPVLPGHIRSHSPTQSSGGNAVTPNARHMRQFYGPGRGRGEGLLSFGVNQDFSGPGSQLMQF
ncbi:phosphatidylinositide phosphatase SAC2-like [Mobula hypostoma]|uniref:phosphatidylinositide phosphatase SAC2-like n=1 Tax=Mobula hypostoma TaxID=723540 RepID=UPI002FC2FE07